MKENCTYLLWGLVQNLTHPDLSGTKEWRAVHPTPTRAVRWANEIIRRNDVQAPHLYRLYAVKL
jgi:hypothetical protein